MLPHDLEPQPWPLPPGDRRRAVLCTGNSLRHRRFGYRLQQRFPGLIQQWFTWEPKGSAGAMGPRRGVVARALAALRGGSLWRELRLRRRLRRAQRALGSAAASENRFFGGDVEHWSHGSTVEPKRVADPNDAATVAAIGACAPYLLLVFGGPLLSKELLSQAPVALNQHAGWSPRWKGSGTIERALYHRQLKEVGSTVHLMTTAADAGAILRRSLVTLHPDDTVHDVNAAVIALGTELMIDAVAEILSDVASISTYAQPRGGETLLGRDLAASHRLALARDWRAGWLEEAMLLERDF